MEEDINRIKYILEFWKKTGIQYVLETDDEKALTNILNELERLQKDNYKLDRENQLLFEANQELQKDRDITQEANIALESALNILKTENSNITRELLARTDELNKLLDKNKKFITVKVQLDDVKEYADKLINEVKEDYIPKQVIRDKIEEYEGLKEMDKMAYEEQIRPLKELLGEE